MNLITKNSPRYQEIVIVHSKENYEINHNLLEPGEIVECPQHKDMFIKKDEAGEVELLMKSYSKNPFAK